MSKKLELVLSLLVIALVIAASILSVKFLLKFLSFAELSRSEWAFELTEIKKLNELGYYGINTTIGIIDTGINLEHNDLAGVKITAWKDFVFEHTKPYDDNGHGTHIAGILAAKGKIKGIAPEAKFIIVKALRGDGTGNDSTIAEAIRFCIDPNKDGDLSDGADVICLSLGGRKIPALGTESEKACKEVIEHGVFVVAAAGNDYPNRDVATPGTVELVISVGAIDSQKEIADFSSKGNNPFFGPFARDYPNEKPELVAPGVEILSTWSWGYASASGTSQAAPFVAGSIALLLDAYPEYQQNSSLTISYFKRILADTAEELNDQTEPHDDRYGYGLVQVWDAYSALG